MTIPTSSINHLYRFKPHNRGRHGIVVARREVAGGRREIGGKIVWRILRRKPGAGGKTVVGRGRREGVGRIGVRVEDRLPLLKKILTIKRKPKSTFDQNCVGLFHS